MLFSSVFLTSLAFVSASDHNGVARRHNSLNRRQSSLTGDSTCGNSMCVQAVLNGTSIEYTLSKKAGTSGTPGWMGVGFGARMGGSEMVIMWANSDGTITLSQRKATGYVEPKVATPTKVATLSNSLSTTSGDVKFVFTMDAPTTKLDDYNIVFGYGSTNPGSSAADATLQQHLDYGFGEFDLTKAFTSTGTASGSAPSATSTGSSGSNSGSNSSDNDDRPLLPYQRAILAHGIICVIGFLFFLPAGALLARYLRTFSNSWFAGHWISQFAISGPIIIAGLALGVSGVSQAGAEHFDDEHKRWGVIIVILYFLQCIVGAAIHWVKPKRSTGRPPQNYFHAVLGLLIIALALYQVRSGYNDEWPKTTGRGVYRGVNIIWWIWVVLFPVLYLAGVALLPRQLRQEAASRGRSNKGLSQHDYAFNMEHINTQQHIQPQQHREPQHIHPQYMQPQQRKYYD